MDKIFSVLDANEAVADVAYRLSEVIAIYPITPSSPMGEWADTWMSQDRKNLWNTIPSVIEMQSEGGAAGALHGALQTGSFATTFTASQGLMLMIPNMYKIAGELTSAVIHVAARSLAAQGLSIFGDHSDVMAVRQTGFALFCSDSVQCAQDFALISHLAALEGRIPFLHFFDGFRTSHEISKIELISDELIKKMIQEESLFAHKRRALNPENPVLRGTAQNPDVYFQARETVNAYYPKCAAIVERLFGEFEKHTGRSYKLYEYFGAPDAERIIILMGSGAEAVHETVEYLLNKGEKVGVIKVRLYRPFLNEKILEAIPKTVKSISVLDRTKEPGSAGEPLYLDVVNAFFQDQMSKEKKWEKLPRIVGGRYGLSSKEFTPAMVKAIYEQLKLENPKHGFTVGILDDLTNTSIDYDTNFTIEKKDTIRSVFYGLGSDGTVGANKNSIKIIGENTDNYVQGYFVYDSKKSGSMTISHLRFGKTPIRSTYLVDHPNFVACHQPLFLERFDMLAGIEVGGTFLLNINKSPDEVWESLPGKIQKDILDKKINFYVIDAYKAASSAGMKNQINTVMQTCFFSISGVLPKDEAIEAIKEAIRDTYGKKGGEIVTRNIKAVDDTLKFLNKVDYSKYTQVSKEIIEPGVFMSERAPAFVKGVLGKMLSAKGDLLPVSAMPVDGTYPTGTSKWEKRRIAQEVPVWDKNVCIQCGKCAYVCPHAVIRVNAFSPDTIKDAPTSFEVVDSKVPDLKEKGFKFTLQISADDCTGCGICVDICPAKNKSEVRLKAINMAPMESISTASTANWEYFLTIPPIDRSLLNIHQIRQQQMQEPLFEFSGACAGCGETPYVKLVSQLFGDRMVIANATGCSSIYGGNLPTTPWTKNKEGRGPAWSNSLFEDNAEFGYGFRVSIDKQKEAALELVNLLKDKIGISLAEEILNAKQSDEADIFEQRKRVEKVNEILKAHAANSEEVRHLLEISDSLVKKSVWIIGGDGWGYDIGYGGLDHVLASGRNVNVLLLDTEVYSNTGGQMSKSTPKGAVAKFATGGKPGVKKDLGLIAMSYGNIYVATVAMGAKDEQTLRALLEAEKYDGPSIVIAYSHCIAHGINMTEGMKHQKAAVDSGQWILYRYNPDRALKGLNPLEIDSAPPHAPVRNYFESENRFKMLTKSKPEIAKDLFKQAQEDINVRYKHFEFLAGKNKEEEKHD
jgi:pyruvate-ferredoxin/flavodoxin oxidoreductase